MKKFSLRLQKGFTVLEFLVVMAIMGILMSIVLAGLTDARSQTRDEARISTVQAIAVGLAQYRDICRQYPAVVDSTTAEPCLNNETFASLVPEIANINPALNTNGSEYHYYAIDGSNPSSGVCTSFHLWVTLESSTSAYAANSAKFDSTSSQNAFPCAGNVGTPINAADPANADVFDIHQ